MRNFRDKQVFDKKKQTFELNYRVSKLASPIFLKIAILLPFCKYNSPACEHKNSKCKSIFALQIIFCDFNLNFYVYINYYNPYKKDWQVYGIHNSLKQKIKFTFIKSWSHTIHSEVFGPLLYFTWYFIFASRNHKASNGLFIKEGVSLILNKFKQTQFWIY